MLKPLGFARSASRNESWNGRGSRLVRRLVMATRKSPSTTGSNGRRDRDSCGRFAKGNRAAVGHPLAAPVAKLRAELVKSVRPSDIRAIARRLVKDAKGGDYNAVRLVLSYALGPPVPSDLLARIEELESIAAGFEEDKPCSGHL